MAQRNNSKGTTDRVQLRMTWARSTAPEGNAVQDVYNILSNAAGLPWPECHLDNGNASLAGGFIQLLDMDLSSKNRSEHTTRVGYASYVGADQLTTVRQQGLCMVEAEYDDAVYGLGPESMSPTTGWPPSLPAPMPMPWRVHPVLTRRVDQDFDTEDPTQRRELLDAIAADDAIDGVFYLDDETGYSHGYSPLAWVVLYVASPTVHIAIPIREAETFYQVNDATERSCIGAYRGAQLDPATCAPASQTAPPWGCVSDECLPGEAPGRVEGYFLITELEQIMSPLQTTLCISYPTQSVASADGYSGKSCRESGRWDPAKPDQSGLPTGDWCARDNGPRTADCHDAFRSVTYQTYQGFPIRDATCPL